MASKLFLPNHLRDLPDLLWLSHVLCIPCKQWVKILPQRRSVHCPGLRGAGGCAAPACVPEGAGQSAGWDKEGRNGRWAPGVGSAGSSLTESSQQGWGGPSALV